MSGFRGNVINIDDGYIGTLNVGAVVFAASDINPIPGDAFGIYRGTDDSFAVSDPTSGSSNVIVENAFILTSFGLASNKIFTVDTTHPNADFTTIQAAYDASDDGYIILVSPGSYNEQLTLRSGITVEIRGTGPDYASTNIEYVLSGDGYVISGPTSGAGSIVFKNMNIALRYNGFSGSTATILARSSSFGWVFRDCYITAYTLGASGGQTHAILANAASVMEFYNCEIVADDNDGIFNVESIRQTNSTIILNNTDIYGINNYDIHADDPSATLYIDNSNIAGTVNIQNMQNVILDRVSTIGAFAGNITDDDTENLLINRAYGVGLTSGQNEFYKLHLKEIGQVDVGSPGDGQIWYSRAAGRFRMKEGGTVKDMIPYSVLDGYGGGGGVSEQTFQENKNAQSEINNQVLVALDAYGAASADTILFKSGDQAISAAGFVDISNLTFSMDASSNYLIEAFVIYQSSATAMGVRFAVNGPTSPTLVYLASKKMITVPGTASTDMFSEASLTAYDTPLPLSTAEPANNTNLLWEVRGTFMNGSNAGTFALRFDKENVAGTATVKAGSYLKYKKL